MILAAAQTNPDKNDTEANLRQHLQFIAVAAQNAVQLIVFPELSLTGYQRELAGELAFLPDDPRLEIFKEKSLKHGMMIIVGAPVKIDAKLHIGSFIFYPGKTTSVYTKQFLHAGEEKYFSPSFAHNPLIEFGSEDDLNDKISLAICADISNPRHPAMAAKNNTSLYVAGIFFTPNGIKEGFEQLGSYAAKYQMNVLMSNYCGRSCGLEAAGKSAFWSKNGQLVGRLDENTEGLLIASKQNGKWSTVVIPA